MPPPFRPLLFALFVMLVVGAPPRAAHADEPAVRILVATRADSRIPALLTEETSHRDRLRTRRPVQLDVRFSEPGETPGDFIDRLQGSLGSYDVAFATNMSLAREIQRRRPSLPLVFEGGADPVDMCLADSFVRPGRNATGYTSYLSDDDLKMLETLVLAFPSMRTVYVLATGGNYYVPDCGEHALQAPPEPRPCVAGPHAPDAYFALMQPTRDLLQLAGLLRVELQFVLLCHEGDLARLDAWVPRGGQSGLLIPWQSLFDQHAAVLISRVSSGGRPAIYGRRKFAVMGGPLAIEPIRDPDELRASVAMLWRVADGERPSEMPIQRPRGFRIIVNAVAAARQGLHPSLRMLRRADEVIVSEVRP